MRDRLKDAADLLVRGRGVEERFWCRDGICLRGIASTVVPEPEQAPLDFFGASTIIDADNLDSKRVRQYSFGKTYLIL